MRRLLTVLAVLSLGLVACNDDDGDPAGETVSCGSVAFTPNSEDGAGQIIATGLPCDEAVPFVRAAGARTSALGPPSVTVNGFRCVLIDSQEEPLPQAFYECTDGPRKVSFVRS